MFWRFSYSTSQIQTLLDKEDVSLEEIMEEEDVLQECKSNNEKLVEFLTKAENLSKLVNYIISVPCEKLDEKQRFKYSSISCELLTSDINTINEALVRNNEIIDKLYSFIDTDQTLNPLLASYFAKIIGCLIKRNSEYILNYVDQKDNFIELFMRHINTSAIIDVILRFLTTIDNTEMKNKVIQWLKKIQIVKHVINLFDSKYCGLYHSNASQLICDIVRISREQILAAHEQILENKEIQMNETNDNSDKNTTEIIKNLYTNSLLEEIESPENVDKLMEIILDSKDKENCSITYGIDIYLTILESKSFNNENTDIQQFEYDFEKKNIAHQKDLANQTILKFGSRSVLNTVREKLDVLNQILLNKNDNVCPSYLSKNGLLGSIRLSIVKLIAKLIYFNDQDFMKALLNANTLKIIIEMAFEYKMNNFLHSQLSKIIKSSFLVDFLDSKNISELSQILNKQDEEKLSDVLNAEDNIEITKSKYVIEHFLKDCNLIQYLVNAWLNYKREKNILEDKNAKIKQINVGYVGHLTIISNFIDNCYKEGQNSELIKACFDKFIEKQVLEQWKELVELQISDINKINMKDLVKNPFHMNINDSLVESEFTDLIDDDKSNRKFSELQKEMKINCVEEFSLPETQIINFSTRYGISNKTNKSSFAMESNDESAQIFEQICFHRNNLKNQTSEKSGDEDVWISQEIKFSDNYSASSNDDCIRKDNLEDWMNLSGENDQKKPTKDSERQKLMNLDMSKESDLKNISEKLNIENKLEDSSSSSSNSSSSDDDDTTKDANAKNSIERKKSKKGNELELERSNEKTNEIKTDIRENLFTDEKSSNLSSSNMLIDPWNDTEKIPESSTQNWADFGKF